MPVSSTICAHHKRALQCPILMQTKYEEACIDAVRTHPPEEGLHADSDARTHLQRDSMLITQSRDRPHRDSFATVADGRTGDHVTHSHPH